MFHPFYLLVFLVPLSCDEQDVLRTGEGDRRSDSFLPIGDRDIFSFCRGVQPGLDVPDDLFGVFAPGIVGSDDDPVTVFSGGRPHERTFCLVAIAAGAYHRDDLLMTLPQLLDGSQDIDQRIRRMRIIHDADDLLLWRYDIIKPAFGAAKRT